MYAQENIKLLQEKYDADTSLPVDYASLAALAKERLLQTETGRHAYAYYAGYASVGDTAKNNREAFSRWGLRQRVLQPSSEPDHRTSLCNGAITVASPLLMAPIGVQRLIHPDGENATANAAKRIGIPYIHSMAASTSLEDVALATGDSQRWFQMYLPKGDALRRSFLRRAEMHGYSALVVTLDTTTRGWRPLDLNLRHLPFLRGIGIQNYLADPVFCAHFGVGPGQKIPVDEAVAYWRTVSADPNSTWETISQLRTETELPIILKGILHPDDAREAIARGVDGIVVSTHGGRQLDGTVGSLTVLPEIVDAVAGRISVLFDSGIRSGADVLKALALGANAVLAGSFWIPGLALDGAAGVEHAMRCLLADYAIQLAQMGLQRPGDLTHSHLTDVRGNYQKKE